MHVPTASRAAAVALVLITTGLAWPAQSPASAASAVDAAEIPTVLGGDTWLQHHRQDLLPYWDMPEAYGDPVGNFPSFRGRAGELVADQRRGVATLGRGVYGYSVSFMLTGDERYLTLARAGLDWIEAHAVDQARGGYFGELDITGQPTNSEAPKDLFDLASVGMAYAAYFNVTRDPDAEAHLLAIRDLIFGTYYDADYDARGDALVDSMSPDLSIPVDTNANGTDITNLLVPGTGMFLPSSGLLTDPDRRAQFRDDLRLLTELLIRRHKNDAAASNRWMFWGRSDRFGRHNAPETDFGHNLKSYAMVHNANQQLPDRPWDGLRADRDELLVRAWDGAAARWNHDLNTFVAGDVDADSAWWMHDEADQLLAALDLADGFPHTEQLAASAQKFLDVYVDRDPAYPARETFARVLRTDPPGLPTNPLKSHTGKNMLHNIEHALVLYLHGQQLAGQPARLHYAFPAEQALTAVAEPYWFHATGQSRTDTGPSSALPGHRVVTVDFTGIGPGYRPPDPAPTDTTAPETTATVTPQPTAAGWNNGDVTVSLAAVDDLAGVKELHVRVEDRNGTTPDTAAIHPGDSVTLPPFAGEGEWDVTFFSVDALGNAESPEVVTVRIDRTAPSVAGLPERPCVLWPPNGRLVRVADVVGSDTGSGVDAVTPTVTSNQQIRRDVVILGGRVWVRAERDRGRTRVYLVRGTVTDLAGNTPQGASACVVPRHRPR